MNCKPGDLARIVVGWNRGVIVEVRDEWQIAHGLHHWRVTTRGPVPCLLVMPTGVVAHGRTNDFCCADDHLRPINGGEVDVEAEEPEAEAACVD